MTEHLTFAVGESPEELIRTVALRELSKGYDEREAFTKVAHTLIGRGARKWLSAKDVYRLAVDSGWWERPAGARGFWGHARRSVFVRRVSGGLPTLGRDR